MNREIGKFKAKELDTDNWVIGYYFRDTDNLHYIIGLDNYLYSIDPSTLCQLITEIDDVEIYEYDCYFLENEGQIYKGFYYFYYSNGLLYIQKCFYENQAIIQFNFHTEVVSSPIIIKNTNLFIGNWHDGEEYLLNKIKRGGE